MKPITVDIIARTSGFDEATEEVERLEDAIGAFPAQVTIKSCTNCEINIHPSQTMFIKEEEGEDE